VATSSQASDAAGDAVTVRIYGMRFEPASLTVKPGTTVTWVQDSRMPHTVTGKTGGMRSNTLNTRQQFSHTFDAAGTYDYACDFHPSMQGSVIVEADGIGT
jgi:amicyanin